MSNHEDLAKFKAHCNNPQYTWKPEMLIRCLGLWVQEVQTQMSSRKPGLKVQLTIKDKDNRPIVELTRIPCIGEVIGIPDPVLDDVYQYRVLDVIHLGRETKRFSLPDAYATVEVIK